MVWNKRFTKQSSEIQNMFKNATSWLIGKCPVCTGCSYGWKSATVPNPTQDMSCKGVPFSHCVLRHHLTIITSCLHKREGLQLHQSSMTSTLYKDIGEKILLFLNVFVMVISTFLNLLIVAERKKSHIRNLFVNYLCLSFSQWWNAADLQWSG